MLSEAFSQRARRALSCVVMAVLSTSAAGATGPDRSLDAVAAVRAQLEALEHNDDPAPNAGIAHTWRFASPANRQATGPLERFQTLFETRAYGPMLDHLSARVSESRERGDAALVGVVLRAADGADHGYLFQLSRQRQGACAGCWMTDSVVPIPVPERRAAPSI